MKFSIKKASDYYLSDKDKHKVKNKPHKDAKLEQIKEDSYIFKCWAIRINSFKELKKIALKHTNGIILLEPTDILKRLNCEIEILIYDDYIE